MAENLRVTQHICSVCAVGCCTQTRNTHRTIRYIGSAKAGQGQGALEYLKIFHEQHLVFQLAVNQARI